MKLMSVLQREPVRVYLYGVVIAILALLVGIGVLTATVSVLVAGVGAAILAIPATAAIEVARSKVSPVATVNHADGLVPDVPEDEWFNSRPADELDEDEKAAVESVDSESN